MSQVAKRHDMELHGGIETTPDGKPQFNAYIARGYDYWFGDDLDLWIVSVPEGHRMSLAGISKKPWTQSDYAIARELMDEARPLRCDEVAATSSTP